MIPFWITSCCNYVFIGETTVVATVFEIKDSSITELYRDIGCGWGGRQVDEAFKQMLIKIVGAPVIMELYRENQDDYEEMFRDFEFRKRIKYRAGQKICIRIPHSLVKLFEDATGETIYESISNTKLVGKITVVGNKFRMD